MTEQVTEQTKEIRGRASTNSEGSESGTSRDAAITESVNSGEESETSTSENDNETGDPETFPREYVHKLRDEAAKHRTRAQRADELAARLHTSLVAATGRLADPSDLAFDESHLDDENALTAAIDELLARKPHLASRKPSGDVGQGATASGDTVDLAGMLRARV